MSEDRGKDIDVTELISFSNPDDECLPITKCLCGKEFEPWKFIISIYRNTAYGCEYCGAKLYFGQSIKIYEVID